MGPGEATAQQGPHDDKRATLTTAFEMICRELEAWANRECTGSHPNDDGRLDALYRELGEAHRNGTLDLRAAIANESVGQNPTLEVFRLNVLRTALTLAEPAPTPEPETRGILASFRALFTRDPLPIAPPGPGDLILTEKDFRAK